MVHQLNQTYQADPDDKGGTVKVVAHKPNVSFRVDHSKDASANGSIAFTTEPETDGYTRYMQQSLSDGTASIYLLDGSYQWLSYYAGDTNRQNYQVELPFKVEQGTANVPLQWNLPFMYVKGTVQSNDGKLLTEGAVIFYDANDVSRGEVAKSMPTEIMK